MGRGRPLPHPPREQRRVLLEHADTPYPEGIGGAQIFRNRLRLREGPGAIDAEHIGGLAAGIFSLRAPGALLVRAAQRGGSVLFVEMESEAGAPVRLVNPWPGLAATLYRNGQRAEEVSGETLAFPTRAGETVGLAPGRRSPLQGR